MTVQFIDAITSANPNTATNSALTVDLPTAQTDDLTIIEISGYANGTLINPAMATPAGWTKVGEQLDTNGTPASFIAVFSRVKQASDPATVDFTWTNPGQMVAVARSYRGVESIIDPFFWFKSASDANYGFDVTTTEQGWLLYGFANRTGTAWSGTSDTVRATAALPSGSTMVALDTGADVNPNTYTKTAVGSNTSVGVGWAFVLKPASTVPVPPKRVEQWVTNLPLYVAHRGGSSDFVEMTMDAFSKSVAYGATAIEVSVWRTSDGVWVCSHDRTTDRVFGVSNDIPSVTWDAISGLRTTEGNLPIERLISILDAFPNTVIFVDNKRDTDIVEFLNILDAHGGNENIVVKGYAPANTAASAKARNYITWGYYYSADMSTLDATQGNWTLLGLDYTSPQSEWDTIKGYGKPVLGHVCLTEAHVNTAFSKGADGVMSGKVIGVFPQVALDLISHLISLGFTTGTLTDKLYAWLESKGATHPSMSSRQLQVFGKVYEKPPLEKVTEA